MAKIVLTISADNKATQSVKLLNAEVQTLSKTLSSIKVNKNLTTQINALTKHYTAVANAHAKITANANKQAIADEKLRQQQTRSTTESVKLATAQARLEKAQTKTSTTTEQLQKKFANLISTIKSLKNAYPQGTFDSIEQSARASLKAAQDDSKGISELGTAYNELSRDLAVAKAETDKVTTAVVKSGDSIGSLAKKFLLWQVTATLVMKPIRALQNALSSINETLVSTEDRVIELRRVVGDVANANELYDLAQKYGQTFENVSEAMLNFARRGMSWNESLKATEAALLAINVAELDVGQATDGLGAIMAQFGIQASELTNVVDMLNKTADKFPVTTSKILAALQRVGSTASTANLSLEETIGLITTLSKSTNRSGENIGTALNSILNIAQKSSTLDTFAKLGDSVASVVEQYRSGGTSILEVLRAVSEQVQQLDTNQIFSNEDFAGLNEELKEQMGEDFEMLSEIYGTAGTYRRNYFIALLNDLDTVKQVESEIANAQGYSQKENQQYLDTYTAKLNSLQAKWQALANDEQGWLSFKKGLVDLGSGILTVIDAMGGLKTVVVATALVLNKMFVGQNYTSLLKFGDGIKKLGTNIATLFNNIKSKDAWKNFFSAPKKSMQELTKATEQYRKAQELQREATIAQQKATDLQVIANEKAAIATELNTVQETNEVAISGMATATDAAQTAAINAQTVATEAQTIASQKAAVAEQALSVASKEMGAAASSAAGIWGILAFAIYEVFNILDENIEKWTTDNTQEQLDKAKETVNAFTEVTDSYNEQISAVKNYADVIKNINGILSDENSSAVQLEYANNQLLSIQNELIKSNEEYANSLDLVNGKLDEQSEIVRAKSDETAKKIANEYLERNSGAVAEAEKIIKGTNSRIQLGTGTLGANYKEIDILQEAIKSSGISNVDAEIWRSAGGAAWNPFQPLIDEIRGAADGEEFSLKDALGIGTNPYFSKEGWTGKSIAWLNLSGSVTEQLKAIEDIRKQVFDTYKDESGKVTDENAKNILAALEQQYQALNSDDYKNALKTIETNEMYSKYASGDISLGQFQKWLSGDKEWATTWINSLEHLSDVEKENLIGAMEEARDLQKEALGLSEKQLAVEEARAALANAQNQATVRRFNQATGQWEWQVDEKKVAEAQEKLNEAQKNLSDYAEEQAWNETTSAIKDGNATNKSILDIIAKWAEVSMEENPQFVEDIKNIIKQNGVDVTQDEIKVSESGEQTVYVDGKPKSYDNGGIANGLGFMPKATALPETVNDPELTAKILSPVSSVEFDRYTKAMGIMFEQAHNFAQRPQFERVNNSTDNRVDNSGQITMNGVTIGSNARGNTLDELLSMASIIPKN